MIWIWQRERIDGNGMSVGEFAVELGVTVAEIEDLLTGKEAIGREIACQLERVTSIPSDSWIRFELKYREDLKRMSVGSEESCTSSIHDELASLFRQGGRSWVPVYLLMRDVSENELYKPEYSSFSAWLKDEAARCGVTETLLWQRKSSRWLVNIAKLIGANSKLHHRTLARLPMRSISSTVPASIEAPALNISSRYIWQSGERNPNRSPTVRSAGESCR